VAEFVSWEISVSVSNLEEEQNNQLKKQKKIFKRLLAHRGRPRSLPGPREPLAPGERHGMAGLGTGVDQP